MAQISTPNQSRFQFPRWANYLLPVILLGAIGGATYLPAALGFGASARTMAVGYAPVQPVPYSHAVHAGKLGMDCRYCHNTVESTPFANLPATQTCMNCHTSIRRTIANPDKTPGAPPTIPNPNLAPVFNSWASGQSVPWVKVHNLANYAYFNHSAHVSHGVGCVECHGRVDRMDVVEQVQPLSMGWCLDCHRDPGSHLRPKDVAATDMDWNRQSLSPKDFQKVTTAFDLHPSAEQTAELTAKLSGTDHFARMGITTEQSAELSAKLLKDYGIRDVAYMQSCYTCHR